MESVLVQLRALPSLEGEAAREEDVIECTPPRMLKGSHIVRHGTPIKAGVHIQLAAIIIISIIITVISMIVITAVTITTYQCFNLTLIAAFIPKP